MTKRPALADVARLAGVSLGTASNVMNAPERVRPQTRDQVYAAMRELGYGPKGFVYPANPEPYASEPDEDPDRPFLMTVGYISVDLLASIDVMPHRNDRITAQSISKHLGGPAANVAVAAAGLGPPFALDVELATAIGKDPDSMWALERLANSGVRARAVRNPFRDRLSRCIVLLEGDGSRTKINEPLTSNEQGLLPQLPTLPARRPSQLHADGYHIEALLPLVEQLHAIGWQISTHDTGLPDRFLTPEGFERLVMCLDTVFISRRTAARILDSGLAANHLITGMGTLLKKLRGRCDVILTLGADGAAAFPADTANPIRIPAPSARLVDGTGAGDCFVGTYLAQRLHDTPVKEAAMRAAIAAGLSITAAGAQGRIVRAGEIMENAETVAAVQGAAGS
ncbi:PfkB family carbohydrate kinase [Oceaniglobus indicus]|uniref:PfkB family carbohydrate kinase n=1 Tax=Oceaniglobus indicus TaxID=2047749 RepID=UPI000C1773F8|nr:PfkB family carbohydrate kinase [Oceaniglobus indicus]